MKEEVDTLVLQALQDRQQVRERAAEAIDRPGRHHIEFLGVHGLEHGVEPRAAISALGAADAGILIDLDDLPARARGDRFQLPALIAGLLFRRADPQIDSYAFHGGLLGYGNHTQDLYRNQLIST